VPFKGNPGARDSINAALVTAHELAGLFMAATSIHRICREAFGCVRDHLEKKSADLSLNDAFRGVVVSHPDELESASSGSRA